MAKKKLIATIRHGMFKEVDSIIIEIDGELNTAFPIAIGNMFNYYANLKSLDTLGYQIVYKDGWSE